MMVLVALWLCLVGLAVCIVLAVRFHAVEDEFGSIDRHHDAMAALEPAVRRHGR